MKRVLIDGLMPGMILAKPVTNGSGLPVVAAGAELDSAIIQRLGNLGLNSVYVEGEADDADGKTLAELQADLEHRFRGVDQDPVQRMILQRLKHHLVSSHGVREQDGSVAS